MNSVMVGALATVMAAFLALDQTAAQGVPTQIVVRVTAHDAKIIGSAVGGATVTVVAVETGDTLATGVQEGSTGNTRNIMVNPRERGATVYDTPGAADSRPSYCSSDRPWWKPSQKVPLARRTRCSGRRRRHC